jgi:hypothetical protein
MARTPLGILAQSAPLADVFSAQEPVAFLHKRAKCAVALGHDVVCFIQRTATSDANLAALHQEFNFFCRRHEFSLVVVFIRRSG